MTAVGKCQSADTTRPATLSVGEVRSGTVIAMRFLLERGLPHPARGERLPRPSPYADLPRRNTDSRAAALRLADETLVAVEVVALALRSEHARLDRTGGSAYERSERMDERLVHTNHIVAGGAARPSARPPLFVPVLHSWPGSSIRRPSPSGESRGRSVRTTESGRVSSRGR
jgi:hypothetical protein